MLKMAILETQISKNSGGECPPDPRSRKHMPSELVPPPPLKVLGLPLDMLEISHAQQFYNLGISATTNDSLGCLWG